jgi:Zn-dependent M28 family amino/carboxypeptidase
VANINLDMVGRSAEKEAGPITDVEKSLAGPNGVYLITTKENKEISEIGYKMSSELNLIPSDKLSEEFLNGSDYYHFYKNGIPILGISTGLHEDYHHSTDDLAKIDYTKMKRMADLTFLVTLEIANREKPLK